MKNPPPIDGPRRVDVHVHIKNPKGIASIVSAGIAAVRDAGMKGRPLRDAAKNVHPGGFPVILSAEWALYKKGGYGSFLGAAVATQDEIRSEILKLNDAGAGIIKVIASGLVSLIEPGQVTPGGFNRDELLFIVQEAGSRGLGVMAHANGEAAVLAAAEAGVRSIEHGFFMTQRALDMMARKKIYWTPTVGALVRAADSVKTSQEMKKYVADLLASHLKMISKAREIGVLLAVGTDCVLPDPEYKKKYEAELSYFERAGISRRDVLHIACDNGAKLLGM